MKLTLALLALVPLLLAPVGTAQAQGGTISGVVLDRGQAPLPNAQVTVQGTRLASQTDANGHFRIAGVNGTSAVLEHPAVRAWEATTKFGTGNTGGVIAIATRR